MAKFPDAQRKAQSEVDKVVGSGRLPTFADRPSLPYVEAVYREVLRWRPPQPLNTAHTTTGADIYDNLEIPKGESSPSISAMKCIRLTLFPGSQVIANIWCVSQSAIQRLITVLIRYLM